MQMISFETKDGKIIRADLELMERSGVIRAMCSVCPQEETKDMMIPLHGISSETLLKILIWGQFHKDDVEPEWVNKPCPISALEIELQTGFWDKEFLRGDLTHICELLEGANYLEINWLMKLCIQKLFFNRGRLTSYQWEKYLRHIQAFVEFQVFVVGYKEDILNQEQQWHQCQICNFLCK